MTTVVSPHGSLALDETGPRGHHAASISLGARDRRHGALLLNQQFWLWGQDIRHAEGNALLALGCQRHRSPEGRGGTTYVLTLPGEAGGGSLTLWAFGLALLTGEGGIFLPRFALDPRLVTAAEVRRATGAGTAYPSGPPVRPRTQLPVAVVDWEAVRHGLGLTLAWIAAYERHIVMTGAGANREHCLARWKRPVGAPATLASEWDQIAFRVGRTYARALTGIYSGSVR